MLTLNYVLRRIAGSIIALIVIAAGLTVGATAASAHPLELFAGHVACDIVTGEYRVDFSGYSPGSYDRSIDGTLEDQSALIPASAVVSGYPDIITPDNKYSLTVTVPGTTTDIYVPIKLGSSKYLAAKASLRGDCSPDPSGYAAPRATVPTCAEQNMIVTPNTNAFWSPAQPTILTPGQTKTFTLEPESYFYYPASVQMAYTYTNSFDTSRCGVYTPTATIRRYRDKVVVVLDNTQSTRRISFDLEVVLRRQYLFAETYIVPAHGTKTITLQRYFRGSHVRVFALGRRLATNGPLSRVY